MDLFGPPDRGGLTIRSWTSRTGLTLEAGKCFRLAQLTRLGYIYPLPDNPPMPAPAPEPFIVAIVATFRRASLLERLLLSLENTQVPLAVLIVDNADDPQTVAVVNALGDRLKVTRLVPGCNLGCGGGLEYGEREALKRYPQATHFWILDDDVEVAPGALEQMLKAMKEHNAIVACPTILDTRGRMNWIPGLLDHAAFRLIKTRCTPEKYLAHCGSAPVRFSWAAGVSLLVTKGALERFGLHRSDFWIRGEDIEFSLRLTHRATGVFVPDAVVTHVHPIGSTAESERKKEQAMLRNHAYIALHLPHGRKILSKLPGNIWRFLKAFGWRHLGEVFVALWQGGILKRPAGVEPKIMQAAPTA